MRFFYCFMLLLLFSCPVAMGQRRVGATTIYPDTLYPGDNIITIRNDRGIDKIRYRATSNTAVTLSATEGCPKQVDIRVHVDEATTSESIDLTLYDCGGGFATHHISTENWTIRRENTGRVQVGRDTCVPCRIETSHPRTVDSIVVNDPRFWVKVPPGGPPWIAVGNDFRYEVCYRPAKVENVQETIRLYLRRGMPNGGLTHYVIEKPIIAAGVPPPPPPEPEEPDTTGPALPPLEDPTTFRNIVMPTAESLGKGRFFVGNYDLIGLLAGYGVTEEATLLFGAAAVPEFISRLLVVTIGGKYEFLNNGPLRAAVGFQYGFTSTEESDISLSAPYGVISYGDRRNRISLAAGYSWKDHKTAEGTFDRNAYIVAIGGDVTLSRGWKLVSEIYVIESSGILPLVATSRWFGDRYAFDAGLAIDLSGGNDVRGTGSLSGEVRNIRLGPVISFLWKW